jgi:hypothetical protein
MSKKTAKTLILVGNESPSQILQILKDNAETTTQFTYSRPLESEELNVVKDNYAQNGIKLQAIEEERKAVTEKFTLQIKPIKAANQELLETIKHQAETVNEEVYLISDQEQGDMDYYNSKGQVVYTRKLMPQEKQLRMLKVEKTGTNDK